MDLTDPNQRLSQIATLWTMVDQAHGHDAAAVTTARQRLLERYGGAVKKYLHGALRDPEAAEELTQEFALRFLAGKYQGADRERGRFRKFVKGVLGHLIADHFRRRQAQPRPLPLDGDSPGRQAKIQQNPTRFSWRPGGKPCCAVPGKRWPRSRLKRASPSTRCCACGSISRTCAPPRWRSNCPPGWASRPAPPACAKPCTERDRFADLLLDEVVQTLGARPRRTWSRNSSS